MNRSNTFQPYWVCCECGEKYGKRKISVSTFHHDICHCCGEPKSVTEARDWGWFWCPITEKNKEFVPKELQ